ncbi:MAG: hypothetical protein V3U27_15680 [Candidatus Tectomicrobia bacterium]
MPSWNELLEELTAQGDEAKAAAWLQTRTQNALQEIGKIRGNRHVLSYASAFLQKPQAPAPLLQVTHEDVNGFMSVMYGMQWERGLTLLLHTPGGITNAAETIVAYLRSKFNEIEVVIPTFSMSAGTMISMAADRLVMGRQSQVGPIDPQFFMGGISLSARAVVDQFERARDDILQNRDTAHVWAPVLQTIGPALLQEAQNALAYGERMVAGWLEQYMFRGHTNPRERADATAAYLNDASIHKSHGRRIDRDEARAQNIVVEDLETNQELQEHVLTAYHLITLAFEKSPGTKMIASDTGRLWIKNWAGPGKA